jgi:hypothetical protein
MRSCRPFGDLRILEIDFASEHWVVPADLNDLRWISHCRGLVQLPVAA